LNTYLDRAVLRDRYDVAMIVLEGRGDLFGLAPVGERIPDMRQWALIRKKLASRADRDRLRNADGREYKYKIDDEYIFMTLSGGW